MNLKIKAIIKKIKPAVSVTTFLLGIAIGSSKHINLIWEGQNIDTWISIALMTIGIYALFFWTLGSKQKT